MAGQRTATINVTKSGTSRPRITSTSATVNPLSAKDLTTDDTLANGTPAWLNTQTDPGTLNQGFTASNYYQKMLDEQQSAIQQRINASVQANNAYIPQVNQRSDQALQNAYISREQSRVRAPQALSAMGYTGGAAESSLLGISTNYENSRNAVEQSRNEALRGIQQNEAQIRSTGDATLSDASAGYYEKLVAASQQAEQEAQDQANWEAEFAQSQQEYTDAASQQAWENEYKQRLLELQYAPPVQSNYTSASSNRQATGANRAKVTSASSGNYNTVWSNVQRGLGGSNMGSPRAFDAVINYIQQSLKSGMITENEAQQMIGRLNL